MSKMKLFRNIENVVGIPLPKLYRDINLIVNKNESTYEDINNIVINHQDNIKKFLINKDLNEDSLYISNYISKIIKNNLQPVDDIICLTNPYESITIKVIAKDIPCAIGSKGYYYKDTELMKGIRDYLNELKNIDFENTEILSEDLFEVESNVMTALRYITNDKIIFRIKQDSIFENNKYRSLNKKFYLDDRESSKQIYNCLNKFIVEINSKINKNNEYIKSLPSDKILSTFE